MPGKSVHVRLVFVPRVKKPLVHLELPAEAFDVREADRSGARSTSRASGKGGTTRTRKRLDEKGQAKRPSGDDAPPGRQTEVKKRHDDETTSDATQGKGRRARPTTIPARDGRRHAAATAAKPERKKKATDDGN